jgi:hypothetical protein
MSTAWLCWSAWQSGRSQLLADEINDQERNLSFEREFGKIIGRLDLLSAVPTEKYRCAVVTYLQILLGGTFLQSLLGRCQ